MTVSFAQVWQDVGYQEGEDPTVSDRNAQILGQVFDELVDEQIRARNDDSADLEIRIRARVQELAQDEPDIASLISSGEVTDEIIASYEDGQITGVGGLLNEDSLGPLLLSSMAKMIAYGRAVKLSTEVNPTSPVLYARWLLEFFDVRLLSRSDHLDSAVVQFLFLQPW